MSQQPIFLLSLPRSGSTLLQRVLAADEEISTAPEPWVLLPQIYALRERGAFAEYGHLPAARAISAFARSMPGGEADYFEEVRTFVLNLYGRASMGAGRYFLDKTPRYYFIADDLFRLFPEGKFIFLWRDPLAVVASIVDTWARGKWNLERWRHDLFDGVPALVGTYERHAERSAGIRFEDLVTDPERSLRMLSEYLDIPYNPNLITTFADVRLDARMGDKRGTARYGTLSTDPVDKWKSVLTTPVRKRWCRAYLEHIGADRLAVMGYDLGALLTELDAVPTSLRHLGSDLLWPPASRIARIRRETPIRRA